ncbi:MAG: nitrilase-related carbon-nitrogen hydrolase [Candidatus Palauibacterales bacterium]|nr:nitrilase-related carbon-nitrogen hydrolase [Candidatus Palauibacterales bacterium]MDP2584294.1 nitrilase-related carbon-nitrogen hydrolase [Candidatus Palauibacterales bacterium]
MRIALVQGRAGPDRERNLGAALEAMGRAAEAGAGLVAFPELALEPFFPRLRCWEGSDGLAEPVPGPTTGRIARRAAELSLVVVFNLYEVDQRGRRFDSSPVIDADGSLLGVTRMVHITDYPGFHEQAYYHPGDRGAPVYDTAVGRVGVAICYDRHYPEYMRALGVAGAELVVIPQAGTAGEWPEGLYEAEVRAAAFQNGYWAALCNRVGEEGELAFAGESFVVDPEGRVTARGASGEEDLVIADVDPAACERSHARRLFWRDRRPELYGAWMGLEPGGRPPSESEGAEL